MGDGSDLIDLGNADDLTNLAHNPGPIPPPPPPHQGGVLLHPPQPSGPAQVLPSASGATVNATATHLHASAGTSQDLLGDPVNNVAGPSTAGSGLFDNLASSPGPSTASLQARIDDEEV
jgi:hypothetical protein